MKIICQENENAIAVLQLLSNLTIRNIVNFLKDKESASPSEISKKLNISPSTASRCLNDLRKYNLVTAKWKTDSIDDRPLKLYKLVPNLLRCELILTKTIDKIHTEKDLELLGNDISYFDHSEGKGVYISLDDVPFRFSGLDAEIIKEIEKNASLKNLIKKFEDETEVKRIVKKLLTIGLIGFVKN